MGRRVHEAGSKVLSRGLAGFVPASVKAIGGVSTFTKVVWWVGKKRRRKGEGRQERRRWWHSPKGDTCRITFRDTKTLKLKDCDISLFASIMLP